MRPNRAVAAPTAASAAAGSVMSSATASRFSCAPIACSTRSGSRPVATTACPAASAARAMSTPSPRPAPVTIQTRWVDVRSLMLVPLDLVSGPPLLERHACHATRAERREEVTAGGCTDNPRQDPRHRSTVDDVDNRDEVKDFLRTRRARLTPQAAGLTAFSANRRVPGLKRGEVADLAGVSVEYYSQLERGNLAGVSDVVLESLARALQLDDAERAHLADLAALARAAGPASPRGRRRPASGQVRPGVQRLLDLMGETVPAIVNNGRLDAVAANSLGRALFAPVYSTPARAPGGPPNHARFTFLDDRAHDFWIDWGRAADDAVAQLRTQAGRDPYDRALSDLVGELSTRSPQFRTRWAAHDVRLH